MWNPTSDLEWCDSILSIFRSLVQFFLQQQPEEVPRRRSVGARVVGTRIKVYRNGDIFFKGIRVSYLPEEFLLDT